ncbi:MAG TPA: hypothetical protein VKH19_04360, partial [Gemmatimonadaceae bacterium]|nr:hypothetical protein [Gemmatimonadaceae bacterium]
AVGTLWPALLHALSFAAVAAGLGFLYATLRRRFDVVSSIAGTTAVASHGLVVSHAFEARYYGFWLMLCAVFCWAIGVDAAAARSRRRTIVVATVAVLVVTLHWFGILTLVLMVAGAALALVATGQGRDATRRLAPAVAGVVALAVCAPLLLAQRSHFTTPIWVPDLNAAQVMDMGRTFFISIVPVAALVVLLASTFFETRPPLDVRRLLTDPGIASLCALAMMPAAIVVVSLLVQPTMLPRYAIAAALAWAPLTAAATHVLSPAPRIVGCALLAALCWTHLVAEADLQRDFTRTVDADTRAFDAARASGLPIVFQSRHVLYPVAAQRSAMRSEMTLLALPDSRLGVMFPRGSGLEDMQRFFRFERDAVALHVAAYGFPRVVGPAAIDSAPRFVLVGSDASLPRGYKDIEVFARAVFPRYRATRLRDDLTLFTRQ